MYSGKHRCKKISPQFIIALIDGWKNKGLLPNDVSVKKTNSLEKKFLKVYEIYQNKTRFKRIRLR